jgi:hydrogenase maturation protease
VLVDAGPARDTSEPGDLRVLEVGPDDLGSGELDAHGMDPVTVLASLDSLGGTLPRTLVVGCQPLDVCEGIGLSPPVSAAVGPAAETVLRLVNAVGSADPPARAET